MTPEEAEAVARAAVHDAALAMGFAGKTLVRKRGESDAALDAALDSYAAIVRARGAEYGYRSHDGYLVGDDLHNAISAIEASRHG